MTKKAAALPDPGTLESKVLIAQDVLLQLKQKTLIPDDSNGYFFLPNGLDHPSNDWVPESSVQETLLSLTKQKPCTVCAVGSTFVAAVRLYDELTWEQALELGDGDGVGTPSAVTELGYFDTLELRWMEALFETTTHVFSNLPVVHSHIYYIREHANPEKRLKGIMTSIIKEKGVVDPRSMALHILLECPPGVRKTDGWKDRVYELKESLTRGLHSPGWRGEEHSEME